MIESVSILFFCYKGHGCKTWKLHFAKRQKKKKTWKSEKTDSIRFRRLDRFSSMTNPDIEPDRCHGRFTVQLVEPASPIRFSKHWLHVIFSSSPSVNLKGYRPEIFRQKIDVSSKCNTLVYMMSSLMTVTRKIICNVFHATTWLDFSSTFSNFS